MPQVAVEVDYYGVLGVDRKASNSAIEAAVKKSMREWRKRTEAADLSVRQEAELKVKWIQEARATLLDDSRRRTYDAQLSAGGVKQEAIDAKATDESWLDRAIGYLAVADYHSAAYAAREATQVEGNNARCWWIRSRANAGLSRWDDAIYEAQQAVNLGEQNAEYHFHLGSVAEEMQRWDQALREFGRAASLDPQTPMYQLAIGGVYLQNSKPEKALELIEVVYKQHPDDETVSYYLGTALIETAENIPRKKSRDAYLVSSAAEIVSMRRLAARAMELKLAPDEIRTGAKHILDYLDKMERKTFKLPGAIASVAAEGMDGGLATGCLGFAIAAALFLLPAILIYAGFATIRGPGILFILLGGGLSYLWYKWMWVPGWKKNV